MATRLGVEVEFAEKRSSLSLLENVDPLGTIALPAILVGLWIVDSTMPPLIIAFAKPVTIDPSISARRPAAALAIHGAGLFANVAMVFLGALLLYVAYLLPAGFAPFVVQTCRLFVLMNLMLLIIHLVPRTTLEPERDSQRMAHRRRRCRRPMVSWRVEPVYLRPLVAVRVSL